MSQSNRPLRASGLVAIAFVATVSWAAHSSADHIRQRLLLPAAVLSCLTTQSGETILALPLAETLDDLSGNDHDARLTTSDDQASPPYTDRSYHSAHGRLLEVSNAATASPCARDFTLTVSLRADSKTGQVLDASGDPDLAFAHGLVVLLSPPATSCASSSAVPGGLLIRGVTTGRTYFALCSRREVADGEWHTVELTVTRSQVSLRIDGVEDSSERASLAGWFVFPQIVLGGGSWAPPFEGQLANIALAIHRAE